MAHARVAGADITRFGVFGEPQGGFPPDASLPAMHDAGIDEIGGLYFGSAMGGTTGTDPYLAPKVARHRRLRDLPYQWLGDGVTANSCPAPVFEPLE